MAAAMTRTRSALAARLATRQRLAERVGVGLGASLETWLDKRILLTIQITVEFAKLLRFWGSASGRGRPTVRGWRRMTQATGSTKKNSSVCRIYNPIPSQQSHRLNAVDCLAAAAHWPGHRGDRNPAAPPQKLLTLNRIINTVMSSFVVLPVA